MLHEYDPKDISSACSESDQKLFYIKNINTYVIVADTNFHGNLSKYVKFKWQ